MGKYQRQMEKGSRSTEADRHNASNNGGGGNGGGGGGCAVAVLAAAAAVARVRGLM